MPITKTAKRALRSSRRKLEVNTSILKKFEIAIRAAKKSKSSKDINSAFSLTDRAVKNKLIHKNKAARIKSSLTKLLPKAKPALIKTKVSQKKAAKSRKH